MGSPVYRLLTSPLVSVDQTSHALNECLKVFAGIAGVDITEWEITGIWLNIAAYLMFVPSMILVEIYLYKKFNRMNGKTYLDSF